MVEAHSEGQGTQSATEAQTWITVTITVPEPRLFHFNHCLLDVSTWLSLLLSVQCNSLRWTDMQSLEVWVCSSEYISLSIATADYVRSSSNSKCRSHIWQQRVRLMASNTGSSKRACASIYFRFSSLLGSVRDSARISRPIVIKFGT